MNLPLSTGRLLLAFDATYLTSTLAQMELHGQRGMVGGTWDPVNHSQSFLPLDDELDIGVVDKAKSMLEMLIWDPSSKRRNALSICSLPIKDNHSGAGSTKRGSWYMLEVLGQALSHSQGLIRGVICDSHGSHCYIKKCLFGNLDGINKDDLARIPWFSELRYEPLVETCLPRLPAMLCFHQDEVVYPIPGACILHGVSVFEFLRGQLRFCSFL